MKSFHQKKVYRADTEGVRKLTRSAQRKLTVTCIAIGAIALILLGAGLQYLNANNAGTGKVSYEKLEKNLAGRMKEEMAEASSYLEKLDGSVTKNQKTLDEVNQQLVKREESLLEVESTQKKMEENASETSVRVHELEKKAETQVETLQKDMDFIHEDIRSTMEKIALVMQALETAEQESETNLAQSREEMTRVNDAVLEIGKAVQTVETNLQESYNSLDALLNELQRNGESNQSEYVQKLSDVEKSMKELLENDLVNVSGSFADITKGLQEQVLELDRSVNGGLEKLDQSVRVGLAELNGNVDGNFADLGQSLDGRFQQMNTSILMQFDELLAADGNNRDALFAGMESMRNMMEEKLNQVFTSVSNGKKGLASALLTKGAAIGEDATFAQIRDAILNIDQKLVIGVKEIPGTVSYEYHYHTDAAGEYPHTEQSGTKGGCFTNGVPHVHTGSCYEITQYHNHTDDCPTHTYLVDWVAEPYWARDYTCNDQPLNATSSILRCGRGSTMEYYRPSCGFVDGQIIGAHIVYKQDESRNNAASESADGEMTERAESREPEPAEILPDDSREPETEKNDAVSGEEGDSLTEEEEDRRENGTGMSGETSPGAEESRGETGEEESTPADDTEISEEEEATEEGESEETAEEEESGELF